MKIFLAAAALLLCACETLPGGAGRMGLRAEAISYSPAMSSTPGIGFTPDRKSVVTVVVEAQDSETGRLLARRTVKLDWERDTARVRD